jgi:hypothetical protein
MIGSLQIPNFYDNPVLGVKIEYPFYWKVREQPAYDEFVFFPPSDKGATINIQNIQTFPTSMSLNAMISQNLSY